MSKKEIDPKAVMEAYETITKNCINHSYTCQGCPLYIIDPDPYRPSGIPHYTCATIPGDNTPPYVWPELDAENVNGGQIIALEPEAQRLIMALVETARKDPKGVMVFYELINSFYKEIRHE